jgi:hypothetical protein
VAGAAGVAQTDAALLNAEHGDAPLPRLATRAEAEALVGCRIQGECAGLASGGFIAAC